MKLFDEPETAILSEAKVADNEVDNLKKVIDEAAKVTESESSSSSGSQESATYQMPIETSHSTIQGENPSTTIPNERPVEGENSEPEVETVSTFEGENVNTNDEDDDTQSKFQDEVNFEPDPSYDPNYPPLTKWTKDHPKTQIIGESLERVLTRSQLKAKQTALFSQVEF